MVSRKPLLALAAVALALGVYDAAHSAPNIFNPAGQYYTPLYGCDGSTPNSVSNPLCVTSTTIAMASFTTPAGTSAYANNNLIANSATAGSVVPLTFTNACRVAQGTGMVRRARIKTPDTGFAGGALTLKLYRSAPTVTNGDHGAFVSTESDWIGDIPVTLNQAFSDNEKGIGAPAVGAEINFDCAAASTNLYGLLVAGGAITPQGAKTVSVVLEILEN